MRPSVEGMEAPASLDVVEDVIRREVGAQHRRADAADARAGLVLGVAGLIVSVGHGGWPPLALAARFLAGTAAVVALGTFGVSGTLTCDAERFARAYAYAHPLLTRRVLLRTDAEALRLLRARAHRKVARARLASTLVVGALALATTAASVEHIG